MSGIIRYRVVWGFVGDLLSMGRAGDQTETHDIEFWLGGLVGRGLSTTVLSPPLGTKNRSPLIGESKGTEGRSRWTTWS